MGKVVINTIAKNDPKKKKIYSYLDHFFIYLQITKIKK